MQSVGHESCYYDPGIRHEPASTPAKFAGRGLGWATAGVCFLLLGAAAMNVWSGANSREELAAKEARRNLRQTLGEFGERARSSQNVIEKETEANIGSLVDAALALGQNPDAKAALEITRDRIASALDALTKALDDRPESERKPADGR